MMTEPAQEPWNGLWAAVDAFEGPLRKSKAAQVTSLQQLERAKHIVQHYFRVARPELEELRVPIELIGAMDGLMQHVLELANGLNGKRTYLKALGELRALRDKVEFERELLIGKQGRVGASSGHGASSGVELAVVETLSSMLPSAALSYEQALRDLAQPDRGSYRGTASELREVLREVLDHLAPDGAVEKADGYSLEKGRTKPTMKQKVKFILRSRDVPSGAVSTPEAAIERIEEASGSLARSIYNRGSLSAHVASSRREVQQLKLYIDGVLAELLEVHR